MPDSVAVETAFIDNIIATRSIVNFQLVNNVSFKGIVQSSSPHSVLVSLKKQPQMDILKQNLIYMSCTPSGHRKNAGVGTVAPADGEVERKPSTKPPMQDIFLNEIRKNKMLSLFFLKNGARLTATVTVFDNYTILLKTGQNQTLVYKQNLYTVIPINQEKKKIIKFQPGKTE